MIIVRINSSIRHKFQRMNIVFGQSPFLTLLSSTTIDYFDVSWSRIMRVNAAAHNGIEFQLITLNYETVSVGIQVCL